MRYIEYGRAKMRIDESAAKKQERINSGRDVLVGVKKYWIYKDDRDDGDGKGNRNEGGEDSVDALRIDNAAVRESQTRRFGELKDNKDENKVREALNRLERSADLSKDDNNDNNGINNRKNGKNGDSNVGGRRREETSTSRGNHPLNIYQGCPWRQRLSDARWGRYYMRWRRGGEGTHLPLLLY